jgi:hypothetical protein
MSERARSSESGLLSSEYRSTSFKEEDTFWALVRERE